METVPAVIGPPDGLVGRGGRPGCTPTRARTSRLAGGCCADGGISPRIVRCGIESAMRPGRQRWKVERSLAWLPANRRLTVRYERRTDLLTAFWHLVCALICARKLGVAA